MVASQAGIGAAIKTMFCGLSPLCKMASCLLNFVETKCCLRYNAGDDQSCLDKSLNCKLWFWHLFALLVELIIDIRQGSFDLPPMLGEFLGFHFVSYCCQV